MSAHDISEHVRAPASEPSPSAGPLVLAKLGIDPADLLPVAGYVGIACGVTAWYVAFAHATFGRELFPVWALK